MEREKLMTLEEASATLDALLGSVTTPERVKQAISIMRAAIVEECAKIAEQEDCEDVAKWIRVLAAPVAAKEKP